MQRGQRFCSYEAREGKRDRQTFISCYLPRATGSFFGLIAVRIWIQCCVYGNYAATDSGTVTVVANLVRTAVIVLLVLLFSHVTLKGRVELALTWASIAAMTAAAVLYLVQVDSSSTSLKFAAAALGGAGIAWGGGMWIKFFVRLDAVEAFFYAAVCLGISSALGFFAGLMPKELSFSLCVFLPSVSVACYWQSMATLDARRSTIPEPPMEREYDAEPKDTLMRLVWGLVLLEFVAGLVRGFPAGQSIPLSVGFQALHQFGVLSVSLAVAYWVLCCNRSFTLKGNWQFQISMMVGGVLLIAVLGGVWAEAGAALITIANTLFVGVLWFAAYDYSRHTSKSCYIVLGLAWVAHLLPREIGRNLIGVVDPLFSGSTLVPALLICALSLSMFLIMHGRIPRTRPMFSDLAGESYTDLVAKRAEIVSGVGSDTTAAKAGEGEASRPAASLQEAGPEAAKGGGADRLASMPDAAPVQEDHAFDITEDHLRRRCDKLKDEFSLTEREADMAFFIAQGRSKSYIAKALFISENTVKSYTRNLYQKVDVHSKQQLIDMLERCR